MKEPLFIAQSATYALVFLLGFLFVVRTGRLWMCIAMVWTLQVLLTGLLAVINLAFANLSMTASMAKVQLDEPDRLTNVLADGTHLLFMLQFGWIYGVAVGAFGMRYRKFREERRLPTNVAGADPTKH